MLVESERPGRVKKKKKGKVPNESQNGNLI